MGMYKIEDEIQANICLAARLVEAIEPDDLIQLYVVHDSNNKHLASIRRCDLFCDSLLVNSGGDFTKKYLLGIYPDFKDQTSRRQIATVLHEIGHIALMYYKKDCILTDVEKEVQADLFVARLGYGFELHNILESHLVRLKKSYAIESTAERIVAIERFLENQ